MITERQTTQIARQFLAERLNDAIHLVCLGAVILATSVVILAVGLFRAGAQSATHPLKAVTDHLNLKDALHVGHSTGAGHGARYLARHGEQDSAEAAILERDLLTSPKG